MGVGALTGLPKTLKSFYQSVGAAMSKDYDKVARKIISKAQNTNSVNLDKKLKIS